MIGNAGSGTDFNATIGAMSDYASATAEMDALHAYGTSAAAATAPGGFPHADAATFAEARFWSTVRLYDPELALGASIGATLALGLDWGATLSGSTGDSNQRAIVFGNVKLDTLSVTGQRDTDPPGNGNLGVDAPVSGTFVNGDSYNVYGMLRILTQ